MKKIYSLMLAVAATAMVASAAPAKAPVMKKDFTLGAAKTTELTINATAPQALKAPAKANAAAPASLEGQKMFVSYTIHQYDQTAGAYEDIPYVSPVTFSDELNESGVLYYTMEGLFTNAYNLTFPELEVGYLPQSGELVIFADQPVFSMNSHEYFFLSGSEKDGLYQMNLWFTYKDGGFVMDNPQTLYFEDDSSKDVAVDYVYTCYFTTNTTTEETEIGGIGFTLLGDWTMQPYQFTGEATYTFTPSSGTAQTFKDDVYMNVVPNGLDMYYFFQGEFPAIHFTVDATAKTLSATNIAGTPYDLGNGTTLPTYMSTAVNGTSITNKYPMASQVDATYTVANNKTTVTIPTWNEFVNNGTVEINLYVAMSAVPVTFDGDLEAMLIAGVKDVTVAPADNTNAPVEYYNLQGVRVAEPAAGLYIRRQGTEVTKVIIR